MKKLLYIALISIVFPLGGCKDFLEITPSDRTTTENFYQSVEDLRAATAPLYNKVWFDFNDKFYFGLGDGRANNLFAPYSDYVYPFTTLTETALTGPLVSAWQSFYVVVAQSNFTINNVRDRAINVTERQKREAIAEARFMRGVAYWYLASLWGDVPIITNPLDIVNNPVIPTNPQADVFEFAVRDLEYASRWLPETGVNDGRVTRWSALGMLSRVYLSVAGIHGGGVNSGTRSTEWLEKARAAALEVIQDSPHALFPSYHDMFYPQNNNHEESLFALQWVANAGDGSVGNSQQAYFAAASAITGDDAAWGGATYAPYEMLKFYNADDKIRRRATYMGKGDIYPELNSANGGYEYENDQACVKKMVVGSNNDTGGISSRMNSGLATPMLRLAEVYLNYVEASMGNSESTSDGIAVEVINRIRERAEIPALTAPITWDDLFYERRVELAMEGQFWFDLVRRAYYKQTEVLTFMDNQQRTQFYIYDAKTHTIEENGNHTREVDAATPSKLLLPYPESEVVQNPLLREDPVPYEFPDEEPNDGDLDD